MKKISIALALVAMSFSACKDAGSAANKVNKDNLDKAINRDAEIKKGTASISFDRKVHDFGTVNEGDLVETQFKLTNTGKTDLVITKAQGSCGCTVPEWPKEAIKPGESSEIKVKFNTNGKPNRQQKTVTLTTNTESGREVLTIKGSVTPKPKK